MSFSNLSMLIAGIGLFLFGMMLFEETIQQSFGNSIKKTIQRYANSLIKSISIGTISTAILQSSTVVSMIMLGFVGAGILNLTQGIGIVLGANIGTTFTPWMVALLGFKINIEAFTLPMVALGGILLVIGSRYPKLITVAKFLFGFGLLFLGLGYMKESVDVLAGSFSLSEMSLWKSILMGIIITIAIQTSSGTSVMTLTALSSGMIGFDVALGVMIGANIGTAVSTFLVSFLSNTGKHRTKKAIAMTHVLFNFLTAAVVLIFFQPIHFLLDTTGLSSDPVIGIAVFHTLFNILGVITLGWFVPAYTRLIKRYQRDDESENTLFAIQQVSTTMPEEYIVAMKSDVHHLGKGIVSLLHSMSHHINPQDLINHEYAHIKEDCENWMSMVLKYDTANASTTQQQTIESYQLAVIEFLNAIKLLKDIAFHYYYLRESSSKTIHKYMDQFDDKIAQLSDMIEFVIEHSIHASQEKIEQGEQILFLDDTRFLKDIRSSIRDNHDDKENDHYRSQLIKTNRSVVLAGESCIKALKLYSYRSGE